MRAILWTQYGAPEVLKPTEIAKPTPSDDEVLIRVHAATVTAGDCEVRSLRFPWWIALPLRLYAGLIKPRSGMLLGQELAGVIEAVGKNVTQFKVGDAVFGGVGFGTGAYVEYVCVPATSDDVVLASKPSNMTFEEAAGIITGGFEALHFLRQANLQRGQKLLINGAGGSIGTAAVQLAKYYGAAVTAVDSAEKLDMLRSIGADDVIDYTREDFANRRETYDVIFEVVGKGSLPHHIKALKQNGRYLLANPTLPKIFQGLWISRSSSKKVSMNLASRKLEDLLFLKELIEAGHLKTVMDKCYPLEQIVEAHRYVETGRKKGNVAITVVPS
jgi:NADPH:quinone reductase-like Zn-dependent oxidoreductase